MHTFPNFMHFILAHLEYGRSFNCSTYINMLNVHILRYSRSGTGTETDTATLQTEIGSSVAGNPEQFWWQTYN